MKWNWSFFDGENFAPWTYTAPRVTDTVSAADITPVAGTPFYRFERFGKNIYVSNNPSDASDINIIVSQLNLKQGKTLIISGTHGDLSGNYGKWGKRGQRERELREPEFHGEDVGHNNKNVTVMNAGVLGLRGRNGITTLESLLKGGEYKNIVLSWCFSERANDLIKLLTGTTPDKSSWGSWFSDLFTG